MYQTMSRLLQLSIIIVMFSIVLVFPLLAQADSTTWTGNGNDNDWSNSANWDNGVPGAAKDAIIPSGAWSITLTSSSNCQNMTIQSNAQTTLAGNGFGLAINGQTDITAANSSLTILSNTGINCAGNVNVGSATTAGSLEFKPNTALLFNCASAGQYGLIVDAGGALTATGTSTASKDCKISSVYTDKQGYIYLQTASQASFQNCEISYLGKNEAGKYGLSAYNIDGSQSGQGLTIQDCFIHHNYHGVYLSGCAYVNVITNTLSNSVMNGISLYTGSTNTLNGNTCVTNTYYGIFLYTSSGNTVTGNNCYDNSSLGWCSGIYVYSSSGNNLTYNNCSNAGTANQEYGIYIGYNSAYNTVSQNTCFSNTIYGIFLAGASHNTVNNNISYNNSSTATCAGLCLSSATYNDITDNAFYNTGSASQRYGIYCSLYSSSNNISLNTCCTNTYNGIFVFMSSNNTLNGNYCYDNGSASGYSGIYLNSSSSNILTDNNCYNSVGSSSQRYGIYITNSSSNSALNGNTCYNNTYYGFYTDSGVLNLNHETYYGNTQRHLSVQGSGNWTFDSCSFDDSATYDIWVNIGVGHIITMTGYTNNHAGTKDGELGNPPGTTGEVVWRFDITPPTGSIVINNGDWGATGTGVTLTLSAVDTESGVSLMRLSNNAITWTDWMLYMTSMTWDLGIGDGVKTVYVQYKNGAGLDSAVYSDDIVLDTTPPTGSIVINNGAWMVTNTNTVTLTLSAVDTECGTSQMQMHLRNEAGSWSVWSSYQTPISWTVSSGLGTKTVSVQYKNKLGLVSDIYSDSIVIAADHNGNNWNVGSGGTIYGIHYNVNNFTIPSGTVYILSGEILEVNALNTYITGTLSANGRGYGTGQGPGKGNNDDVLGGGGGAGHGGTGGNGGPVGGSGTGGIAYGDEFAPGELGSGGGKGCGNVNGGSGGGAIIIKSVYSITINGTVCANGTPGVNASVDGSSGGGGGSGGSILLSAPAIRGSGYVTANGGAGGSDAGMPGSYPGGGAGGGRLKLEYNPYTCLDIPHDNIIADGGEALIPAQDGDMGSVTLNGKKNEPKNDTLTANDPVYLNTGELYQQTTDLTIPGRGFPFRFTRTYRTQSWCNGTLGYGWDFNYNACIENIGNNINYYDGSGRIDKYVWNGIGFVSPDGFYNALNYITATDTYTLAERDGTVYNFTHESVLSGVYHLKSITDRNNNQMTFTYGINTNPNATDPQYVLLFVSDTLGRIVIFSYTAENRIAYIQDWTGRTINFTYDANGDLWKATSPNTTEYPNGKTTVYTYTSGQPDIKMRHKMLTVTDPKGQTYLSNAYDQKGRVISQTYGSGTFYNEYIDAIGIEPAKVIVTDRNNNRTEYWLTLQGNISKELKYTRGIRPGDPAYFETNYEHITSTERSKTILPKSNSVEYTFDINNSDPKAQGNLLQVKRIDPSNPLNQLITLFTYEPLFNQVKSSTDARGNTTTFYFDYEEATSGDLNGDGLTNQANGNVVKITYPTVTLPDSSQQVVESKFWYNDYGQVIRAIDPAGIKTKYVYYDESSSPSYLWKIIQDFEGTDSETSNTTIEYGYDTVGNITWIKDDRSNTTDFVVNELNQVTERISSEITINGQAIRYRTQYYYDANDNLYKIDTQNIDENGNDLGWIPAEYEYDILDYQTKVKKWLSEAEQYAITEIRRDDHEYITDIIQPEGNNKKTVYDSLYLFYQVIEGEGSSNPLIITRYYDDNNNLERSELGDGTKGAKIYGYDGFDRLTTERDALGNYKITDYDSNNNITRVANYDNLNQLLCETVYSYDELNRSWRKTERKFDNPGGANSTDVITTYYRDQKGRIYWTVQNRDEIEIKTINVYNNLDKIRSTTDALGNIIAYEYDKNGNSIRTTETENGALTPYVTTNVYDNLNRLIKTIPTNNPNDFVEYKYDSRDNIKYIKDLENHITQRNYDGMNHIREVIYKLSDTLNITLKYGLDKNGRLMDLTNDNNKITHYGYDGVNRRISETYDFGGPNSQTRTYQFGQYGQLIYINEPNGSIIDMNNDNSYDNALRLKRKDISLGAGIQGATKEEFEYNGLSMRTTARNYETINGNQILIAEVTKHFDSLGNTLEETLKIGQNGTTKSIVSLYDNLSFRTNLRYPTPPSSSLQISYVPDALNRIDLIENELTTIADYNYIGPNRIKTRQYRSSGTNPITLNIDYNDNRDITNYDHLDNLSNYIAGFNYAYDKIGNRLYEKRLHENPVKGDAYLYDAIYRLTGVKYGIEGLTPSITYAGYTTYDNKEEFALDGVGNRETVITDSMVITYTANSLNQYTQISGTNLTYDNNGNMINDGTNTYIYDYENRLLKVTRKSDSLVLGEYKYDVLKRRIYKKAWDGENYIETYFYYDGVRCIEERNISDTMIAQYVFGKGIDEVLTMGRDSQTYYYHENSLGSIYAVTTATGNVVERYSYDAYGKVSFYNGQGNPISQSSIGNSHLFTGREYDEETGLYYYRARYYNCKIGRFLQVDPMTTDDLFNLYTYVSNNPINFSDASGMDKKKEQPNAGNPPNEKPVTPSLEPPITPTLTALEPPTPKVAVVPCNKAEEWGNLILAYVKAVDAMRATFAQRVNAVLCAQVQGIVNAALDVIPVTKWAISCIWQSPGPSGSGQLVHRAVRVQEIGGGWDDVFDPWVGWPGVLSPSKINANVIPFDKWAGDTDVRNVDPGADPKPDSPNINPKKK